MIKDIKKKNDFDYQIMTTSKNELALTARVLFYDLNIDVGETVMITVQKGNIYVSKAEPDLPDSDGGLRLTLKVRSNGSAVIPARAMTVFGAAPLDFLNGKLIGDDRIHLTESLVTAGSFKEMLKYGNKHKTEAELDAEVAAFVEGKIRARKKGF